MITLPKGGMRSTVKKAQTVLPDSRAAINSSKATEPIVNSGAPEFQQFCQAVDNYTKISEHGEGVWITKLLKHRLDEIKFLSGNKLGLRATVNAILESFLNAHAEEIKNKFYE